MFTARYELCFLLNRLRCVLRALTFIETDEINFDIVIIYNFPSIAALFLQLLL